MLEAWGNVTPFRIGPQRVIGRMDIGPSNCRFALHRDQTVRSGQKCSDIYHSCQVATGTKHLIHN